MSQLNLIKNYFQYNYSLYGPNRINVISPNIIIESPSKEKLRKDKFFITTNTTLIGKILHKENLNELDVIRINNTGGGDCFFKCLCQFFTNDEKYHIHYRKIICEYIQKKIKDDIIKCPYIY